MLANAASQSSRNFCRRGDLPGWRPDTMMSARSYLGWHPTRNSSHHRCHVARVQGWRPCFITLADLRCALSRITAEASPPVDCNHLGSQTSCSSTRLGAFRRHRTTPPRPSGGGHGKIHRQLAQTAAACACARPCRDRLSAFMGSWNGDALFNQATSRPSTLWPPHGTHDTEATSLRFDAFTAQVGQMGSLYQDSMGGLRYKFSITMQA